jgi:hypothetical protein
MLLILKSGMNKRLCQRGLTTKMEASIHPQQPLKYQAILTSAHTTGIFHPTGKIQRTTVPFEPRRQERIISISRYQNATGFRILLVWLETDPPFIHTPLEASYHLGQIN